ncbi:hypothetical protein DSO57_1002772 [Entomophthora muscae]|uniref:Uncharacterized protein n=1 Tax=Entomophthora muscae TaxID=34485 RepID=A0ACC2RNI2_9FUNG|nr:hypothetical protein DSO57_1002772 [Entomophthora muscae]
MKLKIVPTGLLKSLGKSPSRQIQPRYSFACIKSRSISGQPTQSNDPKHSRIFTPWQRIGTPVMSILLIATGVNLSFQTYWYSLYLNQVVAEKNQEIAELETTLANLEAEVKSQAVE